MQRHFPQAIVRGDAAGDASGTQKLHILPFGIVTQLYIVLAQNKRFNLHYKIEKEDQRDC
jgi:hypothetical protein